MSFGEMQAQMKGLVPKFPIDAAAKFINNAWRDVRRKNLWSFLMWENVWISPALVNEGTASVVQGSDTVVFDTDAAAAILASVTPYSPIVARQFRVAAGGIANIWDYEPSTRTATLDRPYGESTDADTTYQLYQCYYPAPMRDFQTFISVRNMANFIDLTLNMNREWLNNQDPQRSSYYFPTHVIPYQLDLNPDSNTYQFPMFELWGAPQQNWTYQLYGLRQGTDMEDDSDELPPQIGEDCVLELAKYKAYEWAEAHKGEHTELQKTDWRFLMGASMVEYKRLFKEYRMKDREYVDNWFSNRKSLQAKYFGYYNSIGGVAFPGFNGG